MPRSVQRQALSTRRAPCILIEGRRPQCSQMPKPSLSNAATNAKRCDSDQQCGPGYCDESASACICPPGWAGNSCGWQFLGACRMSTDSPFMTCRGFGGAMSCECFDQCVAAFGVGSVHHQICFERKDGRQSNHSDMPADLSAVRFFAGYSVHTHGWADIPLSRSATSRNVRWPWRDVRQLIPFADMPLPNNRCPASCSNLGTCIGNHRRKRPRCQCHLGTYGAACELSNSSACINGCTNRGRCSNQFCMCGPGWFGVDCSLTQRHAYLAESQEEKQYRFAPTYVYPLPTEWSWQFIYQSDLSTRNLFSAGRAFAELLHARRDAIVDDPAAAALYFVPVFPNYIGGNLWDPRTFLSLVVRYIAVRYPYWNRTGGADHVFFTTQASSCMHTLETHLLLKANEPAHGRTWVAAGVQKPCKGQSLYLTLASLRPSAFGQSNPRGVLQGRARHGEMIKPSRFIVCAIIRRKMWSRQSIFTPQPTSLTLP